MNLQPYLLKQFDTELERSRRALRQVPDEDHYIWRPHDRSMSFGYLAELVATIPTWIGMQLTRDELDIAPEDGASMTRESPRTRDALLRVLESAADRTRAALAQASEDHLASAWHLKAKGQIVQSDTRGAMIQDTLLHWAHHRGQLTVYLRLLGATVPALYGPSGDDRSFGPGSIGDASQTRA